MCLKSVNWRQYSHSVLLLLVVLASNSHQYRLINTPQPFRHSRIMEEFRNDHVPIGQPTNNNHNIPVESDSVGEVQRTDTLDTKSIAVAQQPADKSVVTSRNSEVRSINASFRELQNLVSDFMAIESSFRDGAIQKRSADGRAFTDYLLDGKLIGRIQKFAEKWVFPMAKTATQAVALQNLVPAGARLFLFKGKNTVKKNTYQMLLITS